MTRLYIQLLCATIYMLSCAVIIFIVFVLLKYAIKHQDDKVLKELWEKEHNPHLPGR